MPDWREEEILEECYLSGKDSTGDFAPLHIALEYLANQIEEKGLSPQGRVGKKIFLNLAKVVIATNSALEHNPWLPCYSCGIEILPQVDSNLVESYLSATSGSKNLIDFYCCSKCGGTVIAKLERTNSERTYHLPWEDPECNYGFDFPLPDPSGSGQD